MAFVPFFLRVYTWIQKSDIILKNKDLKFHLNVEIWKIKSFRDFEEYNILTKLIHKLK